MKSFSFFKKNKNSNSLKKHTVDPNDYIDMPDTVNSKTFEKDGFLSKIAKLAMRAGNQIVEKALLLYYAAINKNTPSWARKVIYGALAYLVLPLDAVPDFVPLFGYTDDLGVITAALATVAMYITPEIKQQARDTKDKWFNKIKK